ncbi:unnamed protein product [Clonostachys rhizophaga]|uniref:Aspartate/glutamate racemase family protein n=1 Tax=Clonostachys rhizophaga TaxID=160324 RepID=A0A9N9VE55_9HYPO|nr:unnamed protein product [Clonostachys rhizophaga]
MASKDQVAAPLGFLAVEVDIARPPGDPYNEHTWSFPLIRETVRNTAVSSLVTDVPYEDSFLDGFVAAGLKLAERGAVGIMTSCGFLALAQKRYVNTKLDPSFTPQASQAHAAAGFRIPSLCSMLPPAASVGIMTYDATRLNDKHLRELDIDITRIKISGAPAEGHLQAFVTQTEPLDARRLESEIIQQARMLVANHPDVACIVLECTNMGPHGEAVQKATGLPVYDVYTLGEWFYAGLRRRNPRTWSEKTQAQL